MGRSIQLADRRFEERIGQRAGVEGRGAVGVSKGESRLKREESSRSNGRSSEERKSGVNVGHVMRYKMGIEWHAAKKNSVQGLKRPWVGRLRTKECVTNTVRFAFR